MINDDDLECLMHLIGSLVKRDTSWEAAPNRIQFNWERSRSHPSETAIQMKLKYEYEVTLSMVRLREILKDLKEQGLLVTTFVSVGNKQIKVYYPSEILLMLEQKDV